MIKKDIRTKSSSTISEIVKRSATLLGASSATVRAALAAIRAVASSALSGEDTALASIMGKLVHCTGKAEEGDVILETLDIIGLTSCVAFGVISSCCSCLPSLRRHLGSRIIPSIQSIVDLTLHLASLPTSSPPITKQALLTLTSVIETVPTFVSSKQLSEILRHSIALRARDEQVSNSVLSVVAKRIGTKALLPVVMDLFATAQKGDATEMEAYFHLVRLALRNTDRATIPSLIKPVFAFFLDVFDLRHRLQKQAMDAIVSDNSSFPIITKRLRAVGMENRLLCCLGLTLQVVNRIEESAIGSFLELVTKLNEGTFKPLFIRLYDWAVIDLSEGKSEWALGPFVLSKLSDQP
jgi:U3 small nucleolar RNA-associated protein 10